MTDTVDQDLHEVFTSLYGDDDWDLGDDDGLLTLRGDLRTDVEMEQIDEGLASEDAYSKLYTRKRLRAAVDSLLVPGQKRNKSFIATGPEVTPYLASTMALPSLPRPAEYAPFSPYALLARLSTFQPASYSVTGGSSSSSSSALESSLGPVATALQGWMAVGRDTLACGSCPARWDLHGLGEIPDRVTRDEVGRRLGEKVKSGHASGCPWSLRSSPPELHSQIREKLHPSITSSLAPLAFNIQQCCLSGPVSCPWTSPLNPTQLAKLQSRLSRHLEPVPLMRSDDSPITSEFASALALFAWYPYHPNSPSQTHIDPLHISPTEILQCRICRRRVGLWSFGASDMGAKAFDLVDEHHDWCPIRGRWWQSLPMLQDAAGAAGAAVGGTAAAGLEGLVSTKLGVSSRLAPRSWRKRPQLHV